jgi:hypothetical protein
MRYLHTLFCLMLLVLLGITPAMGKGGNSGRGGGDDYRMDDNRGRHSGHESEHRGRHGKGEDDGHKSGHHSGGEDHGRHGQGEIEIRLEDHGRHGSGEIEIHRSSGH